MDPPPSPGNRKPEERTGPMDPGPGWLDGDAAPPAGGPSTSDLQAIPTISEEMLAPPREVDSRIDFERGMSYFPRVTLILIVLNVIVFILEAAGGALESKDSIIAAGALSRSQVLSGEVWRFLSAMFLHGGLDHLVGNCMAFYVVGMAMEHAVGRGRMLLIYAASGLAGGVLSMLFEPGPSVGASGAIFGVMGAVTVFLYRYQSQFRLRDKRIGFVLAIWALYQLGLGVLSPFVDNFAHLGGLAAGAVLVLSLPADTGRLVRTRQGQL